MVLELMVAALRMWLLLTQCMTGLTVEDFILIEASKILWDYLQGESSPPILEELLSHNL